MRLKQLLLCTLTFVLVRSYTSDYTCRHDGYSAPDGKCQCTDLYGKSDCSQIQCVNSGVLSPYEFDPNQRCSCPPGFLGLHCEPVQCVAGDVHSFEEVDHARDVSIIITYNTEFQEQFKTKDKGPPIEQTICNSIFGQDGVDGASRVHFYVMENDILTDEESCVDDFRFAITSCDEVGSSNPPKYNCNPRLETSYVLSALDQMGEDSRLIIISNMGIDDFDIPEGIEGIEAIRKKAISMRIQIHSLVISPREPQDNKVYFQDGFKTLRELSESTLGFFINPFEASGGIKFDADGITQVLEGMMPVFFDYVVVDRVITTSSSCNLATDFTVFRVMEEDENDFILTVISNKAAYTNYETQWIGGPVTPTKKIAAGYFNAYNLTTVSSNVVLSYKPSSVYNGNKCVPTTVLVLARSGHLARFAITNDLDNYDATSPYAISGEKNTLVGHFKEHYHEEKLELLNLEFSSTGDVFDVTLDPAPSPRNCQYNAKFGEVACNDGDDTFIRVRDTYDGAAITVQNLYCSPKESAAQAPSSQLLRLLKDAPQAPECEPSPIVGQDKKRALIVAAHATQTIYGLFNGNKDSAIRYLNDLDDLGIYDQYLLNIFNGKQATNTTVLDSYPDFKNALMTYWHNYAVKPTTAPSGVHYDEFAYVESFEGSAEGSSTTDFPSSTTEIDASTTTGADNTVTTATPEDGGSTTTGEVENTDSPGSPASDGPSTTGNTATSTTTTTTTTTAPDEQLYFDDECTAEDVTAVFPLEELTSPFIDARPNSDIIFIYDKKIDFEPEDERSVVKEALKRRLRLIVLLLACEGNDFGEPNVLKQWQSIAAKTGGFAVHFGKTDGLNEFLKYYVDWVQGQTAAAIDNVDLNVDFWLKPVTSTPFKVKANGNYAILVNSVPSVGEVTLSNGFKLVNPTALGNSIAKFDLQATKEETLAVTAAPPQYYFSYISIRVIDLNEDYAMIGFSKTRDDPCLTKEYPDYSPHDPQYPVTVASDGDTVGMTLFDGTGSPLRTGPATGNDGTFALDYNWRCADNVNLFYVSSDVTTADGRSYSRVFTTQCIGEGDGIACINGEQNKAKTECICPHDFTGKLCETPVCQNGGNVTVSLECDCADGYSGFFCENYNGCNTDPEFNPHFTSIANTVIFVVERSKYVTEKLLTIDDKTFDNIRAAQYVVVQYGNENETDVIISTTDKAVLVKVLKEKIDVIDLETIAPGVQSEDYFDAVPAITAALRTQVTGSAQIFWLAEFDQANNFVGSLFDPIARQRVSITALFSGSVFVSSLTPSASSTTTSPDTTVIHPVQMVGGSIFYDENAAYDKFFTNYVAALLAFQSNFERRPNLLASSIECNKNITVNIDKSTEKLFIAANGATIVISSKTGTYSPSAIPGGTVFTFTGKKNVYDGAGEVTVGITGQKDDSYCSNTVTAFNQIQVGYQFVKDDSDTTTMIKTGKGKHLLVTYWTAEGLRDAPTPTATVSSISLTEGFFDSTEIYTTVRNNCSYSLSVPIDCSDGVSAIGVKISNFIVPSGGGIEAKVDKYIPVLCPEGTCEHGTTTEYGCDCEVHWGGDYCTESLCVNGELTGDDCECYTGYTGVNCEVKIDPADRDGIAFLFIQDVCGKDDTLKNEAQSVYTNYMPLLTKGETIYLSTNDPDNSDVVLVKTVIDLKTAMESNRGLSTQCTASIGATLDSYYKQLRKPSSASSMWLQTASDSSVGKARVAHVTSVSIDSQTGSYFKNLDDDYTLDLEFIGITYKNEYFENLDSFKIRKDVVPVQTYDPNVALMDLVYAFGSDETKTTTPNPADIDHCVENLQAAFAFHTDISSVTNMKEYRQKASDIIKSVTKYFSVPSGNIDLDDDTCEFNQDQMKDKTLFYGSIYANESGIGVPTFCMTNMNSYPGTITSADYKQANQVTLQKVVDSYTKWYNTEQKMMCHCFDFKNPNTTAIIMWTPLSPTSNDPPGTVSFADFDKVYSKYGGSFKHIVMPMGFKWGDSPLWQSLVPKEQWTDDASQASTNDIIQQIWTITCRLAGHIHTDQTAEPFNPYAPRSRNGDNQSDDGDQVTDDPNPLPR